MGPEQTSTTSSTTPPAKRLSIPLDLRLVVLLLLAIIAAMLLLWKPWEHKISADSRTVQVTGETTIKATPDEYVFSPTYQFKDTDKNAAVTAAQAKEKEILAQLKAIHIADSQIKTNIDGYSDTSQPLPYTSGVAQFADGYVYTLTVTVTAASRSIAQQIQDYLATTGPIGQISPVVNFSEATRKKLESQARETATKDARAKADQSAKNLGFKVSAVKSVEDGTGFGEIMPLGIMSGSNLAEDKASPSFSVQPGQNDLSYSVTVTYFIR